MKIKNRDLRIKIARDVLAQLRAKRYEATEGVYVAVVESDAIMDMPYEEREEASFKDLFKKDKQIICEVCALGSCFVSLVNINNKCSLEDMSMRDESKELTFERLTPIFGIRNMDLMESAFECRSMRNSHSDLVEYILEAAANWGSQYRDGNERLRAIMINIIRNKGDFKIPKKLLEKAHLNQFLG